MSDQESMTSVSMSGDGRFLLLNVSSSSRPEVGRPFPCAKCEVGRDACKVALVEALIGGGERTRDEQLQLWDLEHCIRIQKYKGHKQDR